MYDKSVFEKTKYFIIDMDGTFYLGNSIIPGAETFIEKLKETGRDFRFFTNNSSNNVEVCRKKLEKMGFPVSEEKIIISSHVTIDYLKRNHPGEKVYLLGNERLTNDFISAGIILTEEKPDVIVLGFDTTLTYERISKAANWMAQGVTYIATHPDLNCPMAEGFMPDTGSMIEMFAASTGKRPLVMGKPMEETVNYVTNLLGCEREEITFVGDRLATDIAIGFNHGIPSALVLSGVTSAEEYAQSPIRASVVAEDLRQLGEYL